MFLHELKQPVSILKGAGPSIAAKLGKLGLATVGDLLAHFPRDYEDRSTYVPFSRFSETGSVFTVAVVTGHEWFGFGRTRTLKIRVRDDSSEAVLLCFNRPFLQDRFPPGSRLVIAGKFLFKYGEIQSSSFEADPLPEGMSPLAGFIPLYPSTAGLQQGTLRRLIRQALDMYGKHVESELDQGLSLRRGILRKPDALRDFHFPPSAEALEASRRSLAYEELFQFQLGIALRIRARKAQLLRRPSIQGILASRLIERLPFTLTDEQRRVLEEIRSDLRAPNPMARLLQGDVGSGKTIVALLSALDVVEAGGQVAFMAPTELLARQHAATAARLLEPLGIRLAFLTGNMDDAARPPLLAELKRGGIDIVVGTHALFSKDVEFASLRYVVIDEQHRFGVMQRLALYRKGDIPDTLMMTATPIPRSLALTLFGDLAVSTIRSMPPGRKPVVTHLARQGNEGKVYEFVKRLLSQGRQAFFVYPLVEDSEKADLKDATSMAEYLSSEVFADYKIGLLHARLKDDQKRRVMDSFIDGEIQVLVATTVIEVGVDIPNAAVMVIEHAERFGLSALHQLRGRIGRSSHQGYCFLVYSDSVTQDAVQRLKALYDSSDGFALAEEDLKMRGPGELLGTAQSGALRLRVANPLKDFELLKLAREDAFDIVSEDPGLLEPAHELYRRWLATREADPGGNRPGEGLEASAG